MKQMLKKIKIEIDATGKINNKIITIIKSAPTSTKPRIKLLITSIDLAVSSLQKLIKLPFFMFEQKNYIFFLKLN